MNKDIIESLADKEPVEKNPLGKDIIDKMKLDLDSGAIDILSRLERGEISNEEAKRKIVELISVVTNPKHE